MNPEKPKPISLYELGVADKKQRIQAAEEKLTELSGGENLFEFIETLDELENVQLSLRQWKRRQALGLIKEWKEKPKT